MAETRKHSSIAGDDLPPAKRRKASPSRQIKPSSVVLSNASSTARLPTTDELAQKGLQRSIGLVLHRLGFDSASPEALESFTAMTETYLTSILDDVRRVSNVARRNQPIPPDFETVLERYNISTSALRPHIRPPIPKRERQPELVELPLGDERPVDLPYLGEELSGRAEKESKQHIPRSFPEFPSIHTYRYTPETIEAVSVPDVWPTAPSSSPPSNGSAASATRTAKAQPPLLPQEIPRGDAKKLREAAAREARLGEEALRRLQRASKLAKQKEMWAVAQRQPARRARMDMWEEAMRELLDEEGAGSGGGKGKQAQGHFGTGTGTQARVEIADRSMVVNADMRYHRQTGMNA